MDWVPLKGHQTMESRRHFNPEQKVAILREHLIEHLPVSDVCEKHHLSPTLFYQWQKTFFENGAAAFQRSPRTETSSRQQQLVDALQAKIQTKDQVIAEIMAEHILLKKELGEI